VTCTGRLRTNRPEIAVGRIAIRQLIADSQIKRLASQKQQVARQQVPGGDGNIAAGSDGTLVKVVVSDCKMNDPALPFEIVPLLKKLFA